MTRTFKVLSLLLTYPERDLQEAIPDLRAALADEGLVGSAALGALAPLLTSMERLDLLALQERYVFLFDRTRSLSLHLFEHIHGESRDRGQAMVDLMAVYERYGLEIDARELPDFLPLFLECLSTLPLDEALTLLNQPLPILSVLRQRLDKRESPYAAVFKALETVAAGTADEEDVRALMAEPDDDPNDLAALDSIWEAEAVTFGNAAAPDACGAGRLATRLRAAQRQPTDPRPPSNGL